MGRGKIREAIRRAQAAEVAGELDEAVRELEDAARLHILRNEEARAAVLVRHGLRLRPGHAALLELLERVGAFEEPEVPDEPVSVVDAAPDLPPANSPAGVPEEPVKVVDVDGEEHVAVPGARPGLVVPQRGPTLADASADHWCSFCCRPKAEAGAMVAGPAGAFICGKCLETAAGLLGTAAVAAPDRPAAQAVPEESKTKPAAPGPEPDFIEAAVVLSKKLGWGLSDLRALGREELLKALKKLEELEELGDG